MEHELAERPATLGVAPGDGMIIALHVSVPVRLLGRSPAGLLMACQVPLRAGSTVRVVTGPAGRRHETELCVDEVSNRPDDSIGGYVLCGRAPSLDTAPRRGGRGERPARRPGHPRPEHASGISPAP